MIGTSVVLVISPLISLMQDQVKNCNERFGISAAAIYRAIPFNIHTPLCTRSIKFEPLRKKDQSADTNTPPEIKKFLPYPSEKMERSKDADAHNP